MSNIKERILGAVTVMSEQEATTLWEIIIDKFSSWNDIEEVTPDDVDTAMLHDIENNSECQQFVSTDDALKILGM